MALSLYHLRVALRNGLASIEKCFLKKRVNWKPNRIRFYMRGVTLFKKRERQKREAVRNLHDLKDIFLKCF